MARLSASYKALVRLGVEARLRDLEREKTELLKILSGLPGAAGAAAPLNASGRPKRVFSAAAKRRISAGMRKLWARRRAAAKAAGAA